MPVHDCHLKNYAAPRSYGLSIEYVFRDFGMTDGMGAILSAGLSAE
jgi:hypothetical protein